MLNLFRYTNERNAELTCQTEQQLAHSCDIMTHNHNIIIFQITNSVFFFHI